MRLRSLALAGCLAVATAAGTAAAQDRSGTFEISPFGGGYFGGTLYDAGYNGHIDVSSDWAYGARLAYNVNRVFGVEFDWTHSKADLDANHLPSYPGFPAAKSGTIGHLTQDVYEANAIFTWGKGRALGYFGVGGGAYMP